MSMHQETDQQRSERIMRGRVESGELVGFFMYRGGVEDCTPVSPRAAVWLLQALEGKIENAEPGAAERGKAIRIEYQYGTHRAVLGTYSVYETECFFRGILGYCKRKYKQAIRKVRQAQQREAAAAAAAKKGGLAV